MLVCGTSCLYMTRLLNTPIAGRSAATVDSSRIDMLAGLSKCDILRMPPCLCASDGSATVRATSNPPAFTIFREFTFICLLSLGSGHNRRLLSEPHACEAPAVKQPGD